MKTKTTLCALALSLAPTFALAEGCSTMRPDQTAMSCADGKVLDPATQTCVDQATTS